MSEPVVSLIADLRAARETVAETIRGISHALRNSGLAHEIIVVGSEDEYRWVLDALSGDRNVPVRLAPSPPDPDAVLLFRKTVLDARGDIIAVINDVTCYRVRELEYAVAMVHAGTTDVVFGVIDAARSLVDSHLIGDRSIVGSFCRRVTRTLLPGVPRAPLSGLRVFSAGAAKLLYVEAKMQGLSQDLELLHLARKYGFRCDFLPNAIIEEEQIPEEKFDWERVQDAWRIRRLDAQQAYRQPRRCPICFSADVMTYDQTNGHVIRNCRRCKCRYLGSFPSQLEIEHTRNLRMRKQAESEEDASPRMSAAKSKTLQKRAAQLRRMIPAGSRVLEIGARRGDLGVLLAPHFEYQGIELSDAAARSARARGIEVYAATIENFVNLSSAFDAIVMLDVFQHLPNPHEVLGVIKEQLKSGGQLILVTPDTESFTAFIASKRWSAYKVPEHVILYSRSALIELLEHSGFEIVSATADFHYFDQQRMRAGLQKWPAPIADVLGALLRLLPDPLYGSSGSIRVVARRRSGPPVVLRPVTSVEATHAR
jgi:2-polyprenyl-3-methyl-5-hydroxy-6-metoxy-1,4-benzoquinol methylase